MNNPIALVKLTNPAEVVAYACGKCGIVASSTLRDGERAEQVAREHCGPWVCATCGKEHSRNYQKLCDKCWSKKRAEEDRAREQSRFAAAIKLTPEEYDGGAVFSDDFNHNEGFAGSLDELLDTCTDNEEAPPNYVWLCTGYKVSIDAGAIIESALEGHWEGCEADAEDELIAFVEKWNEKQTGVTWEPDYSRCVVLPQKEQGR